MKGIILAGGNGSRLSPITNVTSKQLLPVYNKPMIYYPLETLINGGIKEILIIIAPNYAGHFLNLLGSGSEWDVKITYEIQEEPKGIAEAFLLGDTFIGKDNVALILGDNIFEDDFSHTIRNFSGGAHIFCKKVSDSQRFGVVTFDKKGNVLSIEEKPESPTSDYAQAGFYLYDNSVIEKARRLSPSPRGEFEITDISNLYLKENNITSSVIDGAWFDCGTPDSLLEASNYVQGKYCSH